MNWKMFRRIYSGLLKYRKLGRNCLFITLTSNVFEDNGLVDMDEKERLKFVKNKFDDLRQRYEYDFEQSFGEYFRVASLTEKGYPHLHIVVCNDGIDSSWLSWHWCDLTGAFRVDVCDVDDECYDCARYIVSQYVSDQNGLSIFGYSRNWVYSGFFSDLKVLKKKCRGFDFRLHEYSGRYYLPVRYDLLNECIEDFIEFKFNYDLGLDYYFDFRRDCKDFFEECEFNQSYL